MDNAGETQTVEDAMQYLQTVENELCDKDFAEFLSIIEDFKSNKYDIFACSWTSFLRAQTRR